MMMRRRSCGGSEGLEVVRSSGHVQRPRAWECEGRRGKSSAPSLKPPEQPPHPDRSRLLNITSPPTLHLSLRLSTGPRGGRGCLPALDCTGSRASGSSNPYSYCLCTYCVPGTVPGTSHPPVLTADMGGRALFAARTQEVSLIGGAGEKWTNVQKGTRPG